MATAEGPQRRLYEVLEIEPTATADEIRAAYKKLALKFHPDKAVQRGVSQEAATARFQEIHRAYEVLSDPHERSFYDSSFLRDLFQSLFQHEIAFAYAEFVKKMDERVLEKKLQRKREEEEKAAQEEKTAQEKLQRVRRKREEEEKAAQAKLRHQQLEEEKLARVTQYEELDNIGINDGKADEPRY